MGHSLISKIDFVRDFYINDQAKLTTPRDRKYEENPTVVVTILIATIDNEVMQHGNHTMAVY